ncbi:MAG: hypothetical protein ABIA76_06250 [Candidatus Diapherotrites archaeon]
MYPDDGGAGAGGDAGGTPVGRKLGMNLEGFIPLILILVIAFFLLMKFGVISSSTPFIGGITNFISPEEKANVLLLGSSSAETLSELYKMDGDLIKLVPRDVPSIERNPKYLLAQYTIVILDQSQSAQKAVSPKLGNAIEEYVKKGGKLITILDSGIYQPGAYDVVGWEATFGDVIPVECTRIYEGNPSCTQNILVRGKLYSEQDDHPIMKGHDEFPIHVGETANFQTFDVSATGTELAYLQDSGTLKTYPAIVEKKLIVGKSIYFNYNPGYTSGIFRSTIEYLLGK